MSELMKKNNFLNEKSQFKTVNIAHRGASAHAPENTIAAFDKALQLNANYFELDVQMTKDEQLIVMHDNEVDRTTNGTGEIKDLSFDEIRQLDAGSWYDEFFSGEKVPSFEEVLDRYHDTCIGILIELKDPELYPDIEQKVADALVERNMDKFKNDKWIIESFDWESLQKFHRLMPLTPIGALQGFGKAQDGKITNEQLMNIANFARYINPNKDLLDEGTIERIHYYDLKTWPYTIDEYEDVDHFINMGVDGIITDNPEFLVPGAGELKMIVRRFAKEGEFSNEEVVNNLELYLTTVHHFEKQKTTNKVITQLKEFKKLLDQNRKYKQVFYRAYKTLDQYTNALLYKWIISCGKDSDIIN